MFLLTSIYLFYLLYDLYRVFSYHCIHIFHLSAFKLSLHWFSSPSRSSSSSSICAISTSCFHSLRHYGFFSFILYFSLFFSSLLSSSSSSSLFSSSTTSHSTLPSFTFSHLRVLYITKASSITVNKLGPHSSPSPPSPSPTSPPPPTDNTRFIVSWSFERRLFSPSVQHVSSCLLIFSKFKRLPRFMYSLDALFSARHTTPENACRC